jgi:hypothetical protein
MAFKDTVSAAAATVYSFHSSNGWSGISVPAMKLRRTGKRKCLMTDEKKKNPYEEIQAELPQPSGYRVVEQYRDLLNGQPGEPEPIIFPAEPPVAEGKPAKTPFSVPFLNPAWKERLRKFAENPVRVYAAAGIGLGILFGIILVAILWHSGSEEGRYDLGVAHYGAAGLKGHLFVEWDKRVKYRLTIEPEEADRQAGFALAVTSSPRPLSVSIHLQDSQGFVLCGKDILLKFDARGAEAQLATAPAASAAKTDPAALPTEQPAQTTDFAKLDAQEAAREKGQDLFQNQTETDGQIAGLGAQGEIPCSKSAYVKTMLWSFTADFPSLAEQDALLNRQQDLLNPPPPPLPPPPPPAAHKKKATLAPLPYMIEGDDAIVEFDPSFGVIETRGRKLFLIDKAAAAAANTAWQDFPVNIHYLCDPMSNCTLMHSGLGSLRVKMRR